MSFETLGFFALFIAALLLYYAVPKPLKNYALLAAALIFYSSAGLGYIILLCVVILTSFAFMHLISSAKTQSGRKSLLAAALIVLFANLAFFKYYNLFGKALMQAVFKMGLPVLLPDSGLLMPLGISFYTFTVAGGLIDVYRKKTPPQKSLLSYAAFVSFFPLIASGPIERAANIVPQLEAPVKFNYDNFANGASRILWGFFKKYVVANTIATAVNGVYSNLAGFSAPYIIFATLCYSYQLYCDFSGYSDIAIGVAETFGIKVMENFARPFAAHTFSDLWRRWHISLTSWLREYLYFPLGGSRKGKARAVLNQVIVFTVSGMWHGATLSFVIWGVLNGAYLVIGKETAAIRDKFTARNVFYKNKHVKNIIQTVIVYLLFTSRIVFFRANTLQDAAYVYTHLFTGWEILLHPAQAFGVYKTVLSGTSTLLLLLCIPFAEIIEWLAARKSLANGAYIRSLKAPAKIAIFYVQLAALAFFGVLGSSSFIYFQF